MSAADALVLLKYAPQSPMKRSALNTIFTQEHAVGMIRGLIKRAAPDAVLETWVERRVMQVCQDRRRPIWNAAAP